jgi:tRNA threonylcarbamoyl adenosine modification protein YeaZ
MFFLGINTATAKTSVALVENADGGGKFKTVFASRWESKRNEAEKLIPQIKIALKKTAPDYIFAVGGPGAFTSLRIGVTVANTLAYLYNAPIISCSTTDFLRLTVPEAHRKNTAVILKAGGEFVVVRLPSSKKLIRLEKKDVDNLFTKNRSVKFAVSDMSVADKKKFSLSSVVKWLPESKLIPFDKIVEHFAEQMLLKKIRAKKQIEPAYLLPPKITVSKKEMFV